MKATTKKLLRKYLKQCTARGLLDGNEPIDDVFESDSDDGTESGKALPLVQLVA
jgi:hypothetical protein